MRQAVAPVASRITLTDYRKTAKGRALVQSGKVFAFEGRFWQGHRGDCFYVKEELLSPREVQNAFDIDGTKSGIIQRLESHRFETERKRRIENAKRKSAVLLRRNEIMSALAQQRAAGAVDPELEEAARDFGLIDGPRPERPRGGPVRTAPYDPLVRIEKGGAPSDILGDGGDLTESDFQVGSDDVFAPQEQNQDFEDRLSRIEAMLERLVAGPTSPSGAPATETEISTSLTCEDCGKPAPDEHPNPVAWLAGHQRGAHTPRRKRAPKE